jgi:sn-glycerol 3-phosphate transport system substrate-binding protein
MKRLLGTLTLIMALVFTLSACGSNKDDAASKDDTEGKTNITFWHAMSGSNGDALQEIVDKFNAQSDSVSVEAIFQGSYDESLNKLRAVGGSAEAPAIVQVFEIGTKYMSDSDFITPMQEFVDKDDFDTSILEPNIASYYEIDGKLNSMPFNTSNAVMFYNKDMFKEDGLDPDNPPNSFSEMKDAAKKLSDGKDTYGFTMATIGWFFEQLMANQGALYLDNENGRDGDATASLVNSEEGLNVFNC